MRPFPTLLPLLLFILASPAISAELFRYRGAARDGGTLEYVFESDARDIPKTVTKEKAAEIAAEFMTTFYGIQVGALETQEFRTQPMPFWLVSFSEAIKGPLKQLYFVVVLPDGNVSEQGLSADALRIVRSITTGLRSK